MKRYGYHRTSTREQHLDRGIAEITAYCSANNMELEKIFTDQQTGKNFNRPRYTIMKEDVLRTGDELIITEVDRLGRNKQETLRELQYYRDNICEDMSAEVRTSVVYDRYKQWCVENGCYAENSRNFNQELRKFGTVVRRCPQSGGEKATLLLGYRLKDVEEEFL